LLELELELLALLAHVELGNGEAHGGMEGIPP
jgi:hypothetical protein